MFSRMFEGERLLTIGCRASCLQKKIVRVPLLREHLSLQRGRFVISVLSGAAVLRRLFRGAL